MVREVIDKHFPGWRDNRLELAIEETHRIIARSIVRVAAGGALFPRRMHRPSNKIENQENADAMRINILKMRNAL